MYIYICMYIYIHIYITVYIYTHIYRERGREIAMIVENAILGALSLRFVYMYMYTALSYICTCIALYLDHHHDREKYRPAWSLEPPWGQASRIQRCSGSPATEQDLL